MLDYPCNLEQPAKRCCDRTVIPFGAASSASVNAFGISAAHQQAQQKPSAVIAAVGPFEHKPGNKAIDQANEVQGRNSPSLVKPHEIDIKLLERNGGSGQSSPSVSGMSNRLTRDFVT